MTERKTSELGRPKRGTMTLAALLGLLLLGSGCVLTLGDTGNMQPKKAADGWTSGLSSLLGSVVNAIQQKVPVEANSATMTEEPVVAEDKSQVVADEEVEDFLKEVVGEELPTKVSGGRWADEVVLKKLEEARKHPCKGDCVDDGEGNMVPAALFRAARVREVNLGKKMAENESQVNLEEVPRRSLPTHMDKAQRAIFNKFAAKAKGFKVPETPEEKAEAKASADARELRAQERELKRKDNAAKKKKKDKDKQSASHDEADRSNHRDADCDRSDGTQMPGAIGRSSVQCRCEYPGEDLFGGRRALTWGKPPMTMKPSSAPPGTSNVDLDCYTPITYQGMEVYPRCHPDCKNVKYICEGKSIPGPLFSCPNPVSFSPSGGGGGGMKAGKRPMMMKMKMMKMRSGGFMGFMAAKYGGNFKGGRKGGGRKGGFRHNGRRAPKFGKRSVSSGEFTCVHICLHLFRHCIAHTSLAHVILTQDPTPERVKEKEVKAKARAGAVA